MIPEINLLYSERNEREKDILKGTKTPIDALI